MASCRWELLVPFTALVGGLFVDSVKDRRLEFAVTRRGWSFLVPESAQ